MVRIPFFVCYHQFCFLGYCGGCVVPIKRGFMHVSGVYRSGDCPVGMAERGSKKEKETLGMHQVEYPGRVRGGASAGRLQ